MAPTESAGVDAPIQDLLNQNTDSDDNNSDDNNIPIQQYANILENQLDREIAKQFCINGIPNEHSESLHDDTDHSVHQHKRLCTYCVRDYLHVFRRENNRTLTSCARRKRPTKYKNNTFVTSTKKNHTNKHKSQSPPKMYHIIMTEYGLKKGLKLYKQEGQEAMKKELHQFYDRRVGVPVKVETLTRRQKKLVLCYLIFLKQKNSGLIKARGCADGYPQQVYIKKEDSSSPTVSTEALILSCIIDAYKCRDVATVNIPGAFMHADMTGNKVHVKLEGDMVRVMIMIDKEYKKYVTYENNCPVLYLLPEKTLYGTIQAAYLFWKNLSSQLKELGV